MNTNKLIKAKRNSKVKFLLVPRPQKDPLAADNDAPQHVLVPKPGTDVSKLPDDLDPQLFVSEQETKVGMLERAHTASKLLDPDLMKAMSKDFDYNDPNNIIDDDFMEQAGGLIEPDDAEMADLDDLFDEPEVINFSDLQKEANHDDEDDDNDNYHADEEDNFYGDPNEQDFRDFVKRHQKRQTDDSRSIYTAGSMSSSVMRRTQGLQQIDEHFERFYEDAYADDTEIGALDLNEVKGQELLTNLDQISQLKKEVKEVRKRNHGDDYKPEIVSEHHKNAIIGSNSESDLDDLVEVEVVQRENKIDCESILSYNSNLYNHPKLIMEPRKKTTSTRSNNSDVSMSTTTQDNTATTLAATLAKLSVRPPNETPEERRARKKAIKEIRSERRQERKQNQQVFKSEHVKLMKQQRSNMPALKLA